VRATLQERQRSRSVCTKGLAVGFGEKGESRGKEISSGKEKKETGTEAI
jgi:hypothetical protein